MRTPERLSISVLLLSSRGVAHSAFCSQYVNRLKTRASHCGSGRTKLFHCQLTLQYQVIAITWYYAECRDMWDCEHVVPRRNLSACPGLTARI